MPGIVVSAPDWGTALDLDQHAGMTQFNGRS
jgi:hypothetical protein